MMEERVLIAGAGPVGLAAAANLVRRGVPVTVLEAGSDLSTESRASTFHPPTLDMLDDLGVAPRGVIVDVPDDLPAVVTDPGLLERVLVNLVANAQRFSPAGDPPVVRAPAAGAAPGAGFRFRARQRRVSRMARMGRGCRARRRGDSVATSVAPTKPGHFCGVRRGRRTIRTGGDPPRRGVAQRG